MCVQISVAGVLNNKRLLTQLCGQYRKEVIESGLKPVAGVSKEKIGPGNSQRQVSLGWVAEYQLVLRTTEREVQGSSVSAGEDRRR